MIGVLLFGLPLASRHGITFHFFFYFPFFRLDIIDVQAGCANNSFLDKKAISANNIYLVPPIRKL